MGPGGSFSEGFFISARANDGCGRVFNMGSPIAIPAGHGTNLDKLIAHFKEKAFKEEEEKLQRMKEGNIPGQKPWVEP